MGASDDGLPGLPRRRAPSACNVLYRRKDGNLGLIEPEA